ncbi:MULTISPECIES: hypothetical protein [unclassified Methanoregula]|uniref:hypothetical protein n=1 Tax=unclassified Methanoregula TaxID=2649730 RepID=UPI0009C8D10C|nr:MULTISPECIES: hypothetical protein [unclassified Methanoregula]OPX61837.1 MAG: hypothetical protein A4E33_02716 [Methanoregula sp. PtaB.Bin085]OPY35083.1 MAG: hypothetical protein A4E34_01040 [Methanoregula sp. PtaU1.Bin006]
MDLVNILQQILNFFWLTLPYIFLGFFIANLIKASPYLDLIGLPMSYIARAAHLPKTCSAIFSFYLLNSYSALGMLSENFREKIISEREVIITVLIAYFPKSINSVTFYLAPVALSVFGLWMGGSIIGIEFLICLGITFVGIIAGRALFEANPGHDLPDAGIASNRTVADTQESDTEKNRYRAGILKLCLIGSLKEFSETAIVLVPTGAIIIFLFNIGVQDSFAYFLQPLLTALNLPASSIMVFVAAFMSQMAAIAATGTVATQEGLTLIQCLLIYVLSRALHLGIGQIKSGFPLNVALFGKSLGFRVSAIDFCMLQGATASMVVLLLIVGGM